MNYTPDYYHAEIKNKIFSLKSTHQGNLIEIYTPGEYEGVELDGFILNLSVHVNINSIPQLPYIPPANALATVEEKDKAWYDAVKDSPAKQFGIYIQDPGASTPIRKFGLTCWNIRPGYTENLTDTIAGSFSINGASVAVFQHGSKLFVGAEDYNSGFLGNGDTINFFLDVSQEKSLPLPLEKCTLGIPEIINLTANQPQKILESNFFRKGALIGNYGQGKVYLSRKSAGTVGKGYLLFPNREFEINKTNFFRESIWAIAESDASIYIQEFQ